MNLINYSDSTGLAKKLNREFIWIEQDKTYYDICCERILNNKN